jgi:hypothetical protein
VTFTGDLTMMGVVLVLVGLFVVLERLGVVLMLGGCCLILGRYQLLLVLGEDTLVLIWYHGVVMRMGGGSLVVVHAATRMMVLVRGRADLAGDVMRSVAELGKAVAENDAVVSASDACAGWVQTGSGTVLDDAGTVRAAWAELVLC